MKNPILHTKYKAHWAPLPLYLGEGQEKQHKSCLCSYTRITCRNFYETFNKDKILLFWITQIGVYNLEELLG